MENEILKTAIDKINALGKIDCFLLREEVRKGNRVIDAEIELKYDDIKTQYYVETKKKIVPAHIPRIMEQIQDIQPIVLIADYITPKAKELLKMKNIPYVDTAGNMYLNIPNIYVYIQTDETNRKKIKTSTRAFTKTGIKVLYQFLRSPEYLNRPYRYIGKKENVAIDSVGKVTQDLLREKYIVPTNKREYQL